MAEKYSDNGKNQDFEEFTLRIPTPAMDDINLKADEMGMSINRYIVMCICEKIYALDEK